MAVPQLRLSAVDSSSREMVGYVHVGYREARATNQISPAGLLAAVSLCSSLLGFVIFARNCMVDDLDGIAYEAYIGLHP